MSPPLTSRATIRYGRRFLSNTIPRYLVHFIRHWAVRTGISLVLLVGWLAFALSEFSHGSQRLGIHNRHNASVPRFFWLEEQEKPTIDAFHDCYTFEFVAHYNSVRLHIAVGYVTRANKLAGREEEIWTARKRKLAEARRRTAQAQASASTQS